MRGQRYTFEIFDSYGDGICCAGENGDGTPWSSMASRSRGAGTTAPANRTTSRSVDTTANDALAPTVVPTTAAPSTLAPSSADGDACADAADADVWHARHANLRRLADEGQVGTEIRFKLAAGTSAASGGDGRGRDGLLVGDARLPPRWKHEAKHRAAGLDRWYAVNCATDEGRERDLVEARRLPRQGRREPRRHRDRRARARGQDVVVGAK